MNFEPLSEPEEQITKKIVDAAYIVHKALGPGLLERVYEGCFCREPTQRRLFYPGLFATKAQRHKERQKMTL